MYLKIVDQQVAVCSYLVQSFGQVQGVMERDVSPLMEKDKATPAKLKFPKGVSVHIRFKQGVLSAFRGKKGKNLKVGVLHWQPMMESFLPIFFFFSYFILRGGWRR